MTGRHNGKKEAREILRYRNRVNEALAAHHGFKAPVMSAYLVNMIDQGRKDGLAPDKTADRIGAASWGRNPD